MKLVSATDAPILCLMVMSNTLGSSCVMMIGGASAHVLVGRSPAAKWTGIQSLISPSGDVSRDGEDEEDVVEKPSVASFPS